MRMMHPIPARVIQTLRDYLPAELNLIDSEEGQAETPDIADADYWDYLRPVATNLPCVRLDVIGMMPIAVDTINLAAERIDAYHRFEVWVDTMIEGAEETASTLQNRVMTYTKGIFRVLCISKYHLQTIADPTLWATRVESDGDIRIRPLEGQEGQEGVWVRSGVVPIKVRRIEAR